MIDVAYVVAIMLVFVAGGYLTYLFCRSPRKQVASFSGKVKAYPLVKFWSRRSGWRHGQHVRTDGMSRIVIQLPGGYFVRRSRVEFRGSLISLE